MIERVEGTGNRRALVLSGGGTVGIAWQSGLLAGLADAGSDVGDFGLVLGTSAGAVVGAQVALGLAPATMASAQRVDLSMPGGPGPEPSLFWTMLNDANSGRRPSEVGFAEIGAFACGAQTMSEAGYLQFFAHTFPDLADCAWPEALVCTAYDTESGAMRTWTKSSGIEVLRAVASSCSIPGIFPPVGFEGRTYFEGALSSSTNADLASGYEYVLIVALHAGEQALASERPERRYFAKRTDDEIGRLRGAGSRTLLIAPDADAYAAIGSSSMDNARRYIALEEGARQGRDLGQQLNSMWR